MAYQSITETAKQIRAALKTHDKSWNAKKIGVSCSKGGGAVNVKVKTGAIDLAQVEEIARGFQSVDRCQMTGEILSGGNTFVFCQYTREAEAELAAPHIENVQKAMDAAEAGGKGALVDIDGLPGAQVLKVGGDGFQLELRGTPGMHFRAAEFGANIAAQNVRS